MICNDLVVELEPIGLTLRKYTAVHPVSQEIVKKDFKVFVHGVPIIEAKIDSSICGGPFPTCRGKSILYIENIKWGCINNNFLDSECRNQ